MAARSQTLGLAALRPSRPAHRRTVSRRAEASGNSSSASEQKRELAAMRAEVQLRSMNPSQENVVSAILDLSKQEFGLHGVKFAEIMDKVNECYVFTPCQYTSGAGTDA